MRNRKHRGASRAAGDEDPACESRHGLVELDLGWTVLVSGPAEEVQPGEEANRVRALVKPWRRNGPFRVLRLRVEEVAGRRLLLRPGQIESLYIP
jgi:hypothetical protein